MTNDVILTPFALEEESPGLARLARPGWQVNAPAGGLSGIHRRLAELTAERAGRSARTVSLAGDCCASIPVLAGLQRAGLRPLVVWLDAHGDFNTRETTVTHLLVGMPLAMISGRGGRELMDGVGAVPIPDDDIFLADARDLDPAERALLDSSRVRRFPRLDALLAALPAERPIYVHFDCDVLNPADAPAMRFVAPGGPSLAALMTFGAALRATGRIAALSATLWNFETDRDGRTARVCMSAIESFL